MLHMTTSTFAELAAQTAAAKGQPASQPAAAPAADTERKAPFYHLSVRLWLPKLGSKLHNQMKVDTVESTGKGRVRFAAAPTAWNDKAINKDHQLWQRGGWWHTGQRGGRRWWQCRRPLCGQ